MEAKKKRLLFVNNSLACGGAERVLVNLVSNLPEDRYDITVFTLYSSGIYDDVLPKHIHYRYIFKERGKLFNRVVLLFLCKVLPKRLLHKLLFRESFDYEIAFLHDYPTLFVAASPDRKSKKIAFVFSDFTTNYDVSGFYKNKAECLRVFSSLDKVCFQSKIGREGFFNTVGRLENAQIVHNALDTNALLENAQEPVEQIFTEGAFGLVAVGRLIPLKAFERLVYAVASLKDRYPQLECAIVGDGPDRDRLQALIVQYGVEERVRLIGFRSNPYPYMKQATMFVCTSKSEGYCMVVAEAVTLGLPVLSTDLPSVRDMLENSDCVLIVPNDDTALTSGLEQLLQHPEKLLQMRMETQKIGNTFRVEHRVQEFVQMLES